MRFALTLAVALVAAAPLHADSTAVIAIQEAAPNIEASRDRLILLARASEATSPHLAADAWVAAGRAYEYEGAGDSAIACYRRAIERRGAGEELLLAVDALFRRAGAGDAAEALEFADRAAGVETDMPEHAVRARQAWARHLTGRNAEAWRLFSRIERALSGDPLWLIRMGQVAFDQGEYQKAYGLLYSVCIASRNQSDDAREHTVRVLEQLGARGGLDDQLAQDLGRIGRRYDAYLKGMNARRVRFAGRDRAPLGGTLFAPASSRPVPGLVALLAPDDSLPSWDSLGIRLRDAGFAVLLVDGRGSGASVYPGCPLPAAWAGRRAAMNGLTASDAAEGFRALRLTASVDTTRYTLLAAGSSIYAALLAAERDPRVESLVLISPALEPVERGPAVELVRRIRVPTFFVQSRLDRMNGQWWDPLYRAAPSGISRVADETGGGPGADALRSDLTATERLRRWLLEKKPPRPAAAPPRRTPRAR